MHQEHASDQPLEPMGRLPARPISKVVREAAEYILKNNGPDEEGKGHPTKLRLEAKDLGEALEIARACGLDSGWKEFHFRNTCGVYKEASNVNEVLFKKCECLLKEKFKGDLHSFLTEVTTGDLLSPLTDTLCGREVEVSMSRIAYCFQRSPYLMAQRFLEIKGEEEYLRELRPYQMSRAANGTFKEPEVLNEVLEKKCRDLLQNKFEGDLHRFLREVTKDDLLSPLTDTLCGKLVEVSMSQIGHCFQDSPYLMAQRFLEITGEDEYLRELRPYHMASASKGTFKDPKVFDEVLEKKCSQLLKNKFDGDLHRFLTEVTQDDLLSPLADTLCGREVEVSMSRIGHCFQDSPYLMVQRFLEIKGEEEYLGELRPYHMGKASQGTFKDPKVVDEVLEKKCSQLLKNKFDGDLHRFLTEVTRDDLVSPLTDTLCGRAVEVSMGRIGYCFHDNPYLMVRRYYSIIEENFSYSPLCFIGPPEARERRINGEFSVYDRRLMKREDGRFDTEKFGFRTFSASDKSIVRDLIVEAAFDTFLDRDITYLGLESEQLESLRLIYQNLNLNPKRSTIVEMDERVFNAMKSTVKAFPNGEGRALSKVNFERGKIEDLVEKLEGPYNVVNLDYLGHWSKSKEDTIRTLITEGKLEDEAILVVTLRDTALDKHRTNRAGYSSDQEESLKKTLSKAAKDKYEVTPLFAVPYNGGTSGRETTPMISVAFKLTAINPNCDI